MRDVADCFHRMLLKGSIRRFFCWPSLPAASLGVQEVGGQHVKPEQKVWPMANSLPVGWSWSLYFAQKANLRRISSVGLLSDRGRPEILKPGSKGVTPHYVYVDNFGIQSLEEQAAKEGLDAATAGFEEKHLTVHETAIQCEEASVSGIVSRHGRRKHGFAESDRPPVLPFEGDVCRDASSKFCLATAHTWNW